VGVLVHYTQVGHRGVAPVVNRCRRRGGSGHIEHRRRGRSTGGDADAPPGLGQVARLLLRLLLLELLVG